MTIGRNITSLAYERNGEMWQLYKGSAAAGKQYKESPDGKPPGAEQSPLPVLLQQELRRGYYASVSFTDANFGRVLDALDTYGLKQNTAVIFHAE